MKYTFYQAFLTIGCIDIPIEELRLPSDLRNAILNSYTLLLSWVDQESSCSHKRSLFQTLQFRITRLETDLDNYLSSAL